ncbi:Putative molybdopterin oxidoreductase [Septoria linicola]|uniref:Molybdopterin oxidoreductase n=1 Tax=Septoria linicola TaxID=215465 RepID=A0A9Q9B7F8_9PEZI|nr:Putative molybdopterin oxidoreductase [Septoria linicola]
MSATQTVLWARVLARLEGANPPSLIVVDPRMSESAKKATVHLAPRVGTNMALLNGIQHILFQEGWIDEAFVSEHCINRDILEQMVAEYTPEKVEAIPNVPVPQLRGRCRRAWGSCLRRNYDGSTISTIITRPKFRCLHTLGAYISLAVCG